MFRKKLIKTLLQTHVLNLPIGVKGLYGAKDAVKIKGIKWKVPLKSRWKSGVSVISNEGNSFFSLIYIMVQLL